MKRIRYLNYLLAMMLSLWGLSLNAQITIGTGTSTTSNNPIASCYAYSYTEQVYAQSEINAAGNITSVSFYLNSLAGSTNSNDWTIYMGHTSKSAFSSNSDWVGSGSMTQVFSGIVTYPAAGNWMTITLTTPFAYNNTDNLVIGIDENATSWNCTNQWRYTSDGTNKAIYYRSDGTNPDPASPPSATSTTANRPNVVLGGIMQSCVTPSGLSVSNIATTSADLSWTDNNMPSNTAWDIEWGTSGFTQGMGTTVAVSSNPYSLTGLTANTAYEYYVRADCALGGGGSGGQSSWAGPYSFTTACNAIATLPWTDDLESGSSTLSCWSVNNNNGDADAWGIQTSGTYANSGSQSYQIYTDFNSGSNDDYLISPQITLTGNERLKFYQRVRSSGEPNDFTVLLSTTGTAPADFTNTILANASYSNTSYQEIIVDLSAYTGDAYIAFHVPPGGLDGWYLYIDDITVEAIPACVAPTALTATNLTATSADLGWTESGTATVWDIEWGATGFTQGMGTTVTGVMNPHSLTGLTAETSYDFYVRADCGAAQSSWAGPFTFTTPCVAVTTFPYTENFDGASGTTPPTCWVNDPANGKDWEFNTSEAYGAPSDHTSGSGRFAVIDDSSPQLTTPHNLVSPPFDITGLTTPRLTFWFQNRRATNNPNTNDDSELYIDVYDGTSWVMGVASAVGDITIWTQYAVDLTAYKSANTQIRFRVLETASFYSDPGIDDITIEETPSCVAPSALTATNVTFNSADLGWTENTPTPATSWQIEYGPDGFTPGMGVGTATTVVTGSNPYSAAGLLENTVYDFYVRAICTAGDTSVWSAEGTFTTPLACPLPTALTATNVTATSADLGWTDNAGATVWDVEWGTIGFTQGAGTMITGTMTNPQSITGLSAGMGYDFYVRADCGGNGTSPWVGPFSFATPFQAASGVSCTTTGAVSSVIFTEEFDNNNAGWTGDIGNSNSDWEIPDASGSSNTGASSAHSGANFMNYEASSTSVNQGSIVSPTIDLTGGFDAAELSFWIHAYGADMGTLNVGVGTSAMGPFTTVMTSIGQIQTSGTDAWQNVGVDLTSYIGQTIYIQFTQIDDQGGFTGDMSIDLVEVTTCEKCRAPSNLAVANVTNSSADLGWTENGTATVWDIEWGSQGFTQGMGTTVSATMTNPYQLSGLSGGTSYDFYVRADCGGAQGTSSWAGPFTFMTACDPITAVTLPYTMGFEGASGTNIGDNANLICGTNAVWSFETNNQSLGRVRFGADAPVNNGGNGGVVLDNPSNSTFVTNYLILTLDMSNYTTSTELELYFDLADLGDEVHAEDRVWIRGSNADAWIEVYDWSSGHNTTFATVGAIDIDAELSANTQTVSSTFQVRFGQNDNFAYASDGLGLDNVIIKEKLPNDVSTSNIVVNSTVGCQTAEAVTVDIKNAGVLTQTSIPVVYTVNGGTPVSETWTGSLVSGATASYTFTATYDAAMGGAYDVQVYTMLSTDGDNTNDTTTITRTTAPTYATPYGQDFESNSTDWSYDGSRSNAHNSGSTVIFDNLHGGDVSFTVDMPKVGMVSAGDILKFDYRYTVWSAGTVGFGLGNGDTLNVQISTDCGATYTTIDTVHAGNHTTSASFTTIQTDLSAYAGQTIKGRIFVERGTGDYWIDLDNFYIGAPLAATTSVTSNYNGADVSCNGSMDGAVSVTPTGGLMPYTYAWDVNAGSVTTDGASGLGAGTYTVTVTDAIGNMVTADVTITEPTMVVASISAQTSTSCNGGNDGTATVMVTGGTGPYMYAWDAAANNQTTATATNLAAGMYTVTVTDANACMTTTTVTVTEPTALSVAAGFPIDLAGTTWRMAPQAGALGVGPGLGDISWWSNTLGDVTTRACFFDDEYVFNADGSFSNVLGADTWLEPWQGINPEACGTPVAPHDGTAAATWSYDENAGTITINGTGAYLGLSKVYNGGELNSPAGAAASITYSVTAISNDEMTLDIHVGFGWWRFILEKTAPSAIIDVSCNGGNDGSASVNATGGTAPYTYAWPASAGSVTTSTATGLSAGSYDVTATDANNCTATTTITVSEPAPLAVSVASTSELLEGTTWKMAQQAGALGIGPAFGDISWWSNTVGDLTTRACFFDDEYVFNADGSFSNVLGADTWLENWQSGIGDACGTPIAPHDGTAAATWTYDANAGTMTINGTGAYLGIPKVYNGGELTSPAGAVASITYIVTAIGNDQMTLDIDVGGGWWRFILEKTVSAPAVQQLTNVTCNGGNDGSATVEAMGGTAPYTYTWPASAGSQTTAMVTGLLAGNYDVTATDANNCTSATTVTITEPTAVMVSTIINNNVSCNGLADGSVTVSGMGGTGNYTYAWSDGQTTPIATGLAAGTYGVTLTDDSGCTGDASVTITEPAVLMASTIVDANVSCNGFTDGSTTVTGTGGTMPYTYAWSDGQTTATATNLAAGSYGVTITDANGCTATSSATVTEPVALTASAAVTSSYNGTDVTCNGATDGTAMVTVMGGTMPYTYAWDAAANSQTTATASNLGAGTYNVTITDANNCRISTSVTLTEPTSVTATATETQQASCSGGADGRAMVTPAGGTGPYTYAWDANANNQTTQEATTLAAGSYTVTVTDVNGCQVIATTSVTSPSGLASNAIVFSNVSCAGASDGTINLVVTGGTQPYSYNWDNGMTSEDLFGVAGGTYNVTITDANGCTSTASATVTEPTSITASTTVTNINCNGDGNGAIDLTVSGGTAPYTYVWSNGMIGQDPMNISGGTYTVTITDANGCTANASATVSEPSMLLLATSIGNVNCNGDSTGVIFLGVTGGIAPYTYEWSNGAVTEDISNLLAGAYSVTVTDANGCTSLISATITEPDGLALTTTSTDVTCNGITDGTIDLSVTGGVMPYTYAWDNGAGSMEDLAGLGAGLYSVTVTDANGCSANTSVTVNEPAALATSTAITNVACHGDSTGAVDLTVTGGTTPYSYSWDNMATTEDLANLTAGTYAVTITDANGCNTTTSVTVAEPMAALSASATATDATCNAGSDGSIDLTVAGGTMPYTYAWDNGAGSMEDPSGLAAGTYTVIVTDANNCTITASATINEPTAISAADVVANVSCNGAGDGAVDITVTGGTGTYTYAWSNMATTEDISGLSGGSYTVTITDANNCTSIETYTVVEPMILASTGTTTDVNCLGGADGTITLNVTGGTSPFTYAWSDMNIGNTGSPTGLIAGGYGVTITDANNCSTTDTFDISQPATAITLSISATPTSCFGGSDGSLDLTVTGGTGQYSYVWSNLITTQDVQNVPSGNYTVTVTDGNGCTMTATGFVAQPAGFSSSLSVTDVSCNGDSTGGLDLSISGGTAPYTYSWSNGATTEDLANVPAGAYSVTITDANGCTTSLGQTVNEPMPISISAMVTDASCHSANGGNDGSITATVTGGTAPYTYSWSTGGSSATIIGLVAGSYTVTVTDANNCTMMETYTVGEPTQLVAVANIIQAILCPGDVGAINGVVGGGTPPYNFAWVDPNGNPVTDLNNLVITGTYTATVTDANGCMTTTSASLTAPTPISIDAIAVEDNLCNGDANGTISVTATGGNGTLTYTWDNGSTGDMITGLTAGDYILTITDANNCSLTDTVTVGEPVALVVNTMSVADTNNQSIGYVVAMASGGTAPYTYQWDAAAGDAMTDTVMGLGFGTYEVTVTDANGCTEIASVDVDSILTNTRVLDYVADLNIFPNPTRGYTTIKVNISRYADVNVQVYNIAGQLVQDLGHHHTTNEEFQLDLSNYADGMYLVRFIIDDDVITRKLILSK